MHAILLSAIRNVFKEKKNTQLGTSVRARVFNAGLLARSHFASGRSCDRPSCTQYPAWTCMTPYLFQLDAKCLTFVTTETVVQSQVKTFSWEDSTSTSNGTSPA
jgi:hypothetical protein